MNSVLYANIIEVHMDIYSNYDRGQLLYYYYYHTYYRQRWPMQEKKKEKTIEKKKWRTFAHTHTHDRSMLIQFIWRIFIRRSFNHWPYPNPYINLHAHRSAVNMNILLLVFFFLSEWSITKSKDTNSTRALKKKQKTDNMMWWMLQYFRSNWQ